MNWDGTISDPLSIGTKGAAGEGDDYSNIRGTEKGRARGSRRGSHSPAEHDARHKGRLPPQTQTDHQTPHPLRECRAIGPQGKIKIQGSRKFAQLAERQVPRSPSSPRSDHPVAASGPPIDRRIDDNDDSPRSKNANGAGNGFTTILRIVKRSIEDDGIEDVFSEWEMLHVPQNAMKSHSSVKHDTSPRQPVTPIIVDIERDDLSTRQRQSTRQPADAGTGVQNGPAGKVPMLAESVDQPFHCGSSVSPFGCVWMAVGDEWKIDAPFPPFACADGVVLLKEQVMFRAILRRERIQKTIVTPNDHHSMFDADPSTLPCGELSGASRTGKDPVGIAHPCSPPSRASRSSRSFSLAWSQRSFDRT